MEKERNRAREWVSKGKVEEGIKSERRDNSGRGRHKHVCVCVCVYS